MRRKKYLYMHKKRISFIRKDKNGSEFELLCVVQTQVI